MLKTLAPEWPVSALTRVLDALEKDLLEAPDEEILQAAKDLGMNPEMRGSAAFQGLKFPAKPKISDFFNLDAWNAATAKQVALTTRVERKADSMKALPLPLSPSRKDTSDK